MCVRACVRAGPVVVRTDQEKLLAQLEEELEQSRELVRAQQQILEVFYFVYIFITLD